MVHITEKCLRSLDQEPGGPLCVMYSYRAFDSNTKSQLMLKDGIAVIEMVSDHRLDSSRISEIFGIEQDQISIEKDGEKNIR